MLGLDVGERRIGVAVNEGRVAVPLTIIEHTNRASDIARIAQIAGDERATAIVVGLPVSLSGEEHEQSRLTRKFGDDLAAQIDLPVVYQDESLSTASVGHAAPERRRKRGRKTRVDDQAAAVILQWYIDAQEHAS